MKPTRIEQLMSRNVATCRPEETLNRAAELMWDRDCGALAVTLPDEAGERVVGMITDRDVCMAAYTQGGRLADLAVASAMSSAVQTCRPDEPVSAALRAMSAAQVRRLPVVDATGHVVGMLSLADLAREEARSQNAVSAEQLAEAVTAVSAPRGHELAVVVAA